jgi:hypothetical protein
MIPAGIMSIFVDGRMNWVLSKEYRCEEGNYGRCRPDKRNFLPTGSPGRTPGEEAQTGAGH